MAIQKVFRRYELKYMLTPEQKDRVLQAMAPHMEADEYGRTTIRNLYFDTDSYLLIRRSIEKPAYKEKLRVRSYGKADSSSTVFVELKKKFDHVVYKRRVTLSEEDAMAWLCDPRQRGSGSQIAQEVDYFLAHYETLRPVVFLSYDREAFFARDGSDLRVTFDDHVLCREDDLSLRSDIGGTPLLPDGITLMEIKCSGGIPLWLAGTLSEHQIRKTSFSKYGTAYQTMIFPKLYNKEYFSHA